MVIANGNSPEIVLSVQGIKKSFSRIEVLHGVDFVLRRGEIHGLVGQNGAGKSTLMKIINGVYQKDEGAIQVNGEEVEFHSPIDARHHGISMVFQEFSLVPSMTVLQNLFLARELKNGIFIDEKASREKALQLFKDLEVDINPDEEVSRLSVGSRQVVEIAKALSRNASILILDEPTASLSTLEIESLFTLLHRLKQEGLAIIFVSHHLNEVMTICDRVTVIRDGNVVLAKEVAGLELQDIITAMIGKKLETAQFGLRPSMQRGEPLLEVKNLDSANRFHNISFSLYPGEVLGIAGVLGSGRSELLKTIFGILKKDSGEIILHGKAAWLDHPSDAVKARIFMVPEDRRKNGIIAGDSIRQNVLLPVWDRLAKPFFIDDNRGVQLVSKFIDDLNIRTTSMEQTVLRLSGGNQQKVVFAKCLSTEPQILLLDDPTVGVDIGTRKEIAQITRRLADQGNGVLLVSSEMEELAEQCDRILVMNRGEFIQEIDCSRQVATEESLMHAIQGTASVA